MYYLQGFKIPQKKLKIKPNLISNQILKYKMTTNNEFIKIFINKIQTL